MKDTEKQQKFKKMADMQKEWTETSPPLTNGFLGCFGPFVG